MSYTNMPYIFFLAAPHRTWRYTLSLHDALPILLDRDEGTSYATLASELGVSVSDVTNHLSWARREFRRIVHRDAERSEEQRLNSSHRWNSYAVLCLKKKKKKNRNKSHISAYLAN